MDKLTSFSSITDQKDLLQEVLSQLYKDFNATENDFSWRDDPNAYDKFLQELETYLAQIFAADSTRLKSMLYRVDVSENKLTRVWALHPEGQMRSIANLVLDRELQKVLTRRMFRNK